MTTPPTHRPLATLAALAAVVLVLATVGLAACGNNNDDGGADDAAAPNAQSESTTQTDNSQTGQAPAGEPASDQDQIKTLIANVNKAFKTGDGQTVCNALTTDGQRDIVAYGKVMNLAGNCQDVIAGIAKQNQQAAIAQPKSEVVAVRVRDTNATAIIRIQGAGTVNRRLTKIDGQWKQLPYGLAAAVGTPQTP